MRSARCLRLFCWLLLMVPVGLRAAAPAAEQLLPAETLAFFTLADRDQASQYFSNSAAGLLWADPAMKPFRESVVARIQEFSFSSLERALGIPFTNFTQLIGGQVTFAVVGAGSTEGTNPAPRLALMVDVKGKSNELKTLLDGLKKEWIASGKRLKNDIVRGVEFSTFFIQTQEFGSTLRMVLPDAEKADPTNNAAGAEGDSSLVAITVGQSGSLLLVGTDLQTLGRISTRQTESVGLALASEPAYKAVRESLTSNALASGWINVKAVIQLAFNRPDQPGAAPADLPIAFRPDRLIEATGIGAIESISFKMEGDAQGTLIEFSLHVPEADRRGLVKMIAIEPMDSAPPAFVPSSAVNFLRWRWDGQKAWATMEAMLRSISPEFAGALELGFKVISDVQGPTYDFRKSFVGNLGTDLISFQSTTNGPGATPSPLPPALFLVASPNPDQLAGAVRAAAVLLPIPPPESPVGESNSVGPKVYSLALTSGPATNAVRLHFATNQGYLAFAMDQSSLEAFLSDQETTSPQLRDRADLVEAAKRVGGMNTGFFGYVDLVAFARQTLTSLVEDQASVAPFLNPIAGALDPSLLGASDKPWFDFKLLPPFERISQYFHFAVFSGSSNREGMSFKYFAPTPPKLQ